MAMTYKQLIRPEQYAAVYRYLADEDLLWVLFWDVDPDQWSVDLFVRMLDREDRYVLAGYIDGQFAGLMTLMPTLPRSRCVEIGLTALRPYFRQAAPLCLGALKLACETLDVASFLGRVPAPNRHILHMLGAVGFREIGRVPGMCWYTRKQEFVPGVLVMATPSSIDQVIQGV